MIWQWAATIAIFWFILQWMADNLQHNHYWGSAKNSYKLHERWKTIRDVARLACMGSCVVTVVAFIWALKL